MLQHLYNSPVPTSQLGNAEISIGIIRTTYSMLTILACNGEGQCFYYMETFYTVITHVHWEVARGSTHVGLHVIVLQDPLNGGTVE